MRGACGAHGPHRESQPSDREGVGHLRRAVAPQRCVEGRTHTRSLLRTLTPLSSAANLREITRLGCVDAFLKLLTPANANADAVAFALSLIASDADTIFSRDATVAATTRMLETLRGAAKRSRNASAMGFLFAALAKSVHFHRALCTEPNLAILSKLLVGGSTDVLCASAYALGVVGIYAHDTGVTELLFKVDAPQHLLKLLAQSPPASDKVVRLAIFALACALHPGMTLSVPTGVAVHPDTAFPEPLRHTMAATCDALRAAPGIVEQVYDRAVVHLSTGSTYAAKLLACLSCDDRIKQRCCNVPCARHMLAYTRNASSFSLPTWLAFFIECTAVGVDASESRALCVCIEQQGDGAEAAGGCLSPFVSLFEHHAPDSVFGLPVLLTNFARTSPAMTAVLSIHAVVEHALVAVTRLNHVALHDQVLRFLDALTRHKNDRALRVLFESDPDRVANLLHSPLASIQLLTATLLRRVFKRLNAPGIPSVASQRHLVKLLSGAGDAIAVAVAAARVWGNLFLYDDKRVGFAGLSGAVEALLVLTSRCAAASASETHKSAAKNLHVAVRSVYRSALSDVVQNAMVAAPHFLTLVDLFTHDDERVAHLAIETLIEVAQVSARRKHVAVATVLTTVCGILRDLEPEPASRAVARIDALRLVSVLGKKEPHTQILLLEYKIVDASDALLRSPLTSTSIDGQLLRQCLETLAWISSGAQSPVRSVLATATTVELALRHVESPNERVASAALHLLHRLSFESAVKDMVGGSNGPATVMRALSHYEDVETKRRACSLIRNLATRHDANRAQLQRLGANSYLVALVTSCAADDHATLMLRIKGLYAIAAMAEGTSAVAKRSKHEVVECEDALRLVRLVSGSDERRLCAAWCFALAMLALGSSGNQRKLVGAGDVVALLVAFVACKEHTPLRVCAAQLLAYLAAMPENRAVMMQEGGDALLSAVIAALQSEPHELQQFAALLVANLATRSDENKVRLGACGVVAPLVDRLSSKQLPVLENVLSAVTKLGNHAGNKVKFGSKVCFEKLLALVHHGDLAVRKRAVSAIAVLIAGNDANKTFLLQCDARVVAELCALLKSANGKVVESSMLILGELSRLPDQALEISQFVDVLAVVRMTEHVNVKIQRAALATAANLTKESFNKLRFGVRECFAALLLCLTSDDLLVVELAVMCLANLSFTTANANQIAHASALAVLLKLTAASTAAKDYLTWNEARLLRLDRHHAASERSPHKAQTTQLDSVDTSALHDDGDDVEGDWSDSNELSVYASSCGIEGQSDDVLDFSAFPSRQTAVLEHALLVLSNCAEALHARGLVESVAIKVVCQTLQHPSELVRRCACFVLGVWCKRDPRNQELATRAGVLPTLIQLLNAPALNIVEAALYALCKLSFFGDNHVKMLSLDLVTTLVQGILRRPGSLTHRGLLDRALRLLGTLVGFPKVRQVVKSEEIIADILTSLLQLHRDALAKNLSRLVLVMLEEDSLRFFLPKKTVVLLRAVFTDAATGAKTVRNILRIFRVLALVEEHKTTITLEDSGEALGRMVVELDVVAEVQENLMRIPASAPNAATVLQLLACVAATKRIAAILFEKRLFAVLPRYLAPFERKLLEADEADVDSSCELSSAEMLHHLEMNANAVVIAKHLCASQPDTAVAVLSSLEFTALVLRLLRTSARLAPTRLTTLAFECLVVLEKLCPSDATYDQQVLFQEAAVDVFAFFLALWLRVVADGGDATSLELRCACDALDAVAPLVFISPLTQLLLNAAMHQNNRNALVNKGCLLLLLQAMTVSRLPTDVRLGFAETFAALSELVVAKDVFDRADHVSLLLKVMFAHQRSPELMLHALRSFASVVKLSPASRCRVLDHALALSFLLECLADAASDSHVYYATHVLACLSMEEEIARRLASQETLPLVPQLLLVPFESIRRETQHFATEMVGYMALFGHVKSLQLEEKMVARILSFAAFDADPLVAAPSVRLALWSLAQLAASSLSATVCKWIVDDAARLDVLIKCGLLPPENLGVTSAVVGYVLSILMRIVDVEDAVRVLVNRRICTHLSALLEAVEQDIRVSALQLLALLLPRYPHLTLEDASEQWSAILHHVVEWMEVYARDLSSCSPASLADAFTSLNFLSSLSSLVASDFQSGVLRSGITEIVANTLVHVEFQRRETAAALEPLYQRILLRALETIGHLMHFAAAYSEKLLALGAQSAFENLLHDESEALQLETLQCMTRLATLSNEHNLLFASHRCVVRLRQLAHDARLEIAAKVTSLLALMAMHAPSLPGLCCLDGVNVISSLVLSNWTAQRSELQVRVTDNSCAVLLSMFAPEPNVFALYDQARVVDKLFEVVEKRGMPEPPLRVLAAVSDYDASHARFRNLVPALCRLLAGASSEALGTASHRLVLSILSNLFCCEDADATLHAQHLADGEAAVLPQLLPLSRWVRVLDASSVAIVLKLLLVYVVSQPYATLLNDGANTASLLKLVAADSSDVAVAAAKLLLTASHEREVQISITVEDGIGVLVRTLQRSAHRPLQCLLLTILRHMSPDSEVQVLILNDNGVARLVEFVSERSHASFAGDERLALACELLRQLSHTQSAATQIVASLGHVPLVELNKLQTTDAQEQVTTLEVLVNLAKTSSVAQQLVDAKLHVLFLAYVLSRDATDRKCSRCERLALAGLRALCRWNKPLRRTLGMKSELVPLLEASVAAASSGFDAEVTEPSLALLQYLSKDKEGRASIFATTSTRFIEHLCDVISQGCSSTATPVSPLAATGVKIIANLLTDTSDERVRVSWHLSGLLSLSPLLGTLLADHQQPKAQLTALRVLSGAFLGSAFYFQLSPHMLGDLLNIVLISASRQHCALAEDVVVRAFGDAQRVRASIGGNQILEHLLIVVTQKADAAQRRALGTALTEALYVSIARDFVVNQRFLSKLLSLLASTASSSSTPDGVGAASSSAADEKDVQLVRALCVYLGFVSTRSSHERALQHSICEALRSEVNAPAFASVADQVVTLHAQICCSELSKTPGARSRSSSDESVQLWTLFAACLAPSAPHIQLALGRVRLLEWLCLVDDFFALCTSTEPAAVSVHQHDGLVATLHVTSALSKRLEPLDADGTDAEDDAATLVERKQRVSIRCLASLRSCVGALEQSHVVVQAALKALLDVRDGWGESCLLAACAVFASTGDLLVQLLPLFHSPADTLDESRHLLLQLLLTLVSTGSFVAELKASEIQRAIESNALISAADKALPVAILSLLGFNADLNSEFAAALERCERATSAPARTDGIAFLVNFLQLYAVTDEGLQRKAVDVFMRELVAYAVVDEESDDATSRASAQSAVVGLVKLSAARKFVELFLRAWTLNALLGVAFARRRGGHERASFELQEISQLLELAARVCSWLGAPTAAASAPIEEKTLTNGLALVQTLSRDHLPLVEQLLALLSWLLGDHECFEMVCCHATLLQAFLSFLFEYADSGAALLRLLETCVRDAYRIDSMNELLRGMLAFVYANATELSSAPPARDKLLLCIFIAMKRLGEDGLSGCDVYEHAIQRILANTRAPSVAEARVSWRLLGMLTELDPAIGLLFNVDGVQLLLHELCAMSSSSSRATSASFQVEALQCLSKAARTHDEVLLKIGEAAGVAAILFRVLANGPALLPPCDADAEVMSVGECQEYAAHLIARISSQEDLRASLLSQDHVSALIEALESVHLPVVLYALEALSNLCEFALCLDALVHHATVPVLGQILFSPLAEGATQQQTEALVLGILGSMCSKSKLICRRVVSSNMVVKLNGFLGSPRTNVQHSAAWVIHSLSNDAELVPKLRDAGVLETLCERLLTYDPRTTQRKALGALANLVARGRGSIVELHLRSVVRETLASISRNIPHPQAQRAIAKGLGVFEAIAGQRDNDKLVLVEENAIQTTLALLGAPDAKVRLKALHVAIKWVTGNSDAPQIRELFSDAVLLHLARAVSEELSDTLLVALALLNMLVRDEFLKENLTSMTYEVLLRLVGTHTTASPTAAQSKVLAEALECLVAMTKTGRVAVSTASEIVNSVEPLVVLLQTSASDSIRISALHLLVNFAASVELRGSMLRCGMLRALVGMLATAVDLSDDKVVQLCLLGMALLTASDLSDGVADLAGANVVTLVELLGSRDRSIQANTVWVLSNLSSEGEFGDARLVMRTRAFRVLTLADVVSMYVQRV